MDIKAVFFDLDGTLFTSTRRIEPSTRMAIRKLHEEGIYVGVATGRGPSFVIPLMEDLALDFAVTYNGQYIFTPEEVVFARPIDKSSLREVVDYSLEHHQEVSFGSAEGVKGSSLLKFGETRTAQLVSSVVPKSFSKPLKSTFKNLVRKVKPYNGKLEEVIRNPIYQVMIVATEAETPELEQSFPRLSVTRSNPFTADLISKGSSKLEGISKLGKIFDFTVDEVMAFGDSNNDLQMLMGVHMGVAMGNATPEVKDHARYITATNNQDGIAKALAHFGLINFSTDTGFVSPMPEFNKVKDFHRMMDKENQELPRLFNSEEAVNRAGFKVEELVEFLYAASKGDQKKFANMVSDLKANVDKASDKVLSKNHSVDDALTDEVDALIDLLYFTYGSFVLMGVDPSEIFDIVHKANMGKVFPDGKAHFDSDTHKILKPDDWEENYGPEARIKAELDRQTRVALKKARSNSQDKD